MSNMNRISIEEFRRLGFLQEVNRQFLHPLGLALEVERDEDGTERLGGVWDYRHDPEGIVFFIGPHHDQVDEFREKADRVEAERRVHAEARRLLFGGETVQPIAPYGGTS